MKYMNYRISATGLAVIFSLSACEQKKNNDLANEESVEIAKDANDSTFTDRKEEKDADFIVNAVAGSYAEIKLAQLARNKSVDKKVKDMADKLEADHLKILNELKAFADKNGIAVPLEEGPGDARSMKDLEGKTVDKFDKAWCESLAEKHRKSISTFETRLERTENPELKTWITETLSGLKRHLEMLQDHEHSSK